MNQLTQFLKVICQNIKFFNSRWKTYNTPDEKEIKQNEEKGAER